MSLERDEFEKAKAVAESQGKKLVWIGDRKGNLTGYRLTSNYVRCHFERVVGIGKIRKLLGMSGWKYLGGTPVAVYPESITPLIV
jgi:hypothetical protein